MTLLYDNLTEVKLSTLIKQLLKHFILLGNFNNHNVLWKGSRMDKLKKRQNIRKDNRKRKATSIR